MQEVAEADSKTSNFFDDLSNRAINGAKKSMRLSFTVHVTFAFLIFLCISSFAYLLLSFPRSIFLAISLCVGIVIGFAYLFFLFYLQTKKPEIFITLKEGFEKQYEASLPNDLSIDDYHHSIASALLMLNHKLHQLEYGVILLPRLFSSIHLLGKKLSYVLCWKEVLTLREVLILASIQHHIALIKLRPTDLEAHASLAHCYISLSKLYQYFRDKTYSEHPLQNELKQKMHDAIQMGIEEFTIIDHYAPDDPWVHAQLASCYHAIDDYESEVQEYETILKLCPSDREIMLRLGILYFRQGNTAHGLEIYEALQKKNDRKAQDLISFYDANIKESFSQLL